MDFAEIRARRRPATRTVRLLLDGDLRTEYDRLVVAAGVAERMASKTNQANIHHRSAELAEQVEGLAEQLRASETPFTFQAIPRVEFNDLLAESQPPRPEDEEDGLSFDSTKFVPMLLAACATEPELTIEEATEIFENFSDGEVTALFEAAWRVNKEVRDVPFSAAGTGQIPSSGTNSTTPPDEE